MPEAEQLEAAIDWRLTTWEGAQREQMRRWAQLPLENVIRALEEMEQLAQSLAPSPERRDA